MNATPDDEFDRPEHCRIIATIPRKRTKLSSILQSRYAGTLGGYARQGHKIDAPTQTAWMQGYMLGINAGMKWREPKPKRSGTTSTAPGSTTTTAKRK